MITYPDVGAFSVRLTAHEAAADQSAKPVLSKAIADTGVLFTNNSNIYYTAPMYLGSSLVKF